MDAMNYFDSNRKESVIYFWVDSNMANGYNNPVTVIVFGFFVNI